MQPTAFGAQDRCYFEVILCCAPRHRLMGRALAAIHHCRIRYSQYSRYIILLSRRIVKGTGRMALEAERIYPHCPTVISVVPIGSLTEGELRTQRQRHAILLNEAAEQ